jgi:hypothetical protein
MDRPQQQAHMTTLAQLVERASAHLPTNQPTSLGQWATALTRELETLPTMPDPRTTSDPALNGTEPAPNTDDLQTAAIDALAALMAKAAKRELGPYLRGEAAELINVAMDWGRTAFALCRLDNDDDAYVLAKAVRGIDGDIEPTDGDIAEAHRVIRRMIDGARIA